MKSLSLIVASVVIVLLAQFPALCSGPRAGFFLPDSVNEMTLRYKTVNGLILLPVAINDTIHVNLILDTGCRNLVLFGRKFRKLLPVHSARPVEFSGLGTGAAVTGALSLNNRVSIDQVAGELIPIVIVNEANLFARYSNVDGVVGYEIFLKFEIELNARAKTITFRPALKTRVPPGYAQVPLQIVDARPVMESEIFLDKGRSRKLELMIDTGSTLALLLKTTNLSSFYAHRREDVLGFGLSGPISGYATLADKLVLQDFQIERVPAGIVSSPWHNNASIGMEVLKDYIVVVNYCKAYACFKRNV
jgi:hypothetical protein